MKEWRVSPYAAMDDRTTFPFSSSRMIGSSTPRAPWPVAYSKAWAASGTRKVTSLTPSPCSRTCRAMGDSGPMAPVMTSRASPCSRTQDARSRTLVSGPLYAVTLKPKAFE